MCSATWKFRKGGYELGFNRDEKWARPASGDPMLETGHPVAGACARDGGAGGTWLFTNSHGVTLALMNAYPDGEIPAQGVISRGEIPLLAAAAEAVDEIEAKLIGTNWEQYSPCNLLLLAATEARHYGWDGKCFSQHSPPIGNFLTTSSVAGEEVRCARRERFERLAELPVSEILDDAVAPYPAAAIHVTRQDGGTVSRTSVIVDEREIHFSVRRRGEEICEIVFPRMP